jgi:hypothetical protein
LHWWRVPVQAELPLSFYEALVARIGATVWLEALPVSGKVR